MSSAVLDRLLAALIVGLAASGALSLLSGAPADAWLFVLHDVLAAFLAVAVVAKLVRSVPTAVRGRRWGRLAVAAVVTVVASTSILAGFAWVAGGSIVWVDLGLIRWSLLTLHAVAGLVILPLLVVHLVPRRWRVLRVPPRRQVLTPTTTKGSTATQRAISRRALLTAGGYAAVAVILVGSATTLDTLRGGVRRFTGSRFLPGGPPGVPTTFLGESTPAVDVATWRLLVTGRVDEETSLDLRALKALGSRDVTAILDCTSGWAVEATWTGVPLRDVLARAGAAGDVSRIDVVSVTGWRATLRASEIAGIVLAWTEGGAGLTPDHGAPVRLVAPDHRGLEWVKWVDRIEVA